MIVVIILTLYTLILARPSILCHIYAFCTSLKSMGSKINYKRGLKIFLWEDSSVLCLIISKLAGV